MEMNKENEERRVTPPPYVPDPAGVKQSAPITQSLTFKAFIIGFMCLVLLIPTIMIQSLISERQERSRETTTTINEKWGLSQTISGPVLSIPYNNIFKNADGNQVVEGHVLNIAPEELIIDIQLLPEERYYGIYKAIVYSSKIKMTGNFEKLNLKSDESTIYYWKDAYITMGVSDRRGVKENIKFILDGEGLSSAQPTDFKYKKMGEGFKIEVGDHPSLQDWTQDHPFECEIVLDGTGSMDFIPFGATTKVNVMGEWKSPGFTGNFSPTYTLEDGGFKASWTVLSFNRNIPDKWRDTISLDFEELKFGVNLVDPVDHYQQNMRSAKYAIMFIALTFVVFFFVEVLTHKRIHPVQYLLVGLALILFYTLLLSISEHINFSIAYLIASIATIGLITSYAYSIFKNKTQTGMLAFMLAALYVFLYTILQLEDMALLFGSLGLFIILAIIMYFSRKINWYKE